MSKKSTHINEVIILACKPRMITWKSIIQSEKYFMPFLKTNDAYLIVLQFSGFYNFKRLQLNEPSDLRSIVACMTISQ